MDSLIFGYSRTTLFLVISRETPIYQVLNPIHMCILIYISITSRNLFGGGELIEQHLTPVGSSCTLLKSKR